MTRSAELRVVLVVDAVGGVWDVSLALAAGLLARGAAKVQLVVVGPPPNDAKLAAARAVPDLAVEVIAGCLEFMAGGDAWQEPLRRQVAQLAAGWRAGVVHVNASGAFGLAGLAQEAPVRRMARPPVLVLGVHGDVVTWWRWVKDGGREPSTFPDYMRWQRDLAWQALWQADAVVCPSEFMAGEVADLYGLGRRPVVIHNAVPPLPSPAPPVERERGLAALVGRAWDEAKNLPLVAQALGHCERPWRVEVAGDLVEPGRSPAPPIEARGLKYLGFLDKDALARLFHRASVYVAASRHEPFGLAPVEAALCGCAIVANDLPSYREVWADAALFFARNDPHALAQTLDWLSDHPAEQLRLAAAGRRRAAERYTVGRMVDAHLDLYREALAACAARQSFTARQPTTSDEGRRAKDGWRAG
jgi:glycosyltransferase involved in cell wall biosynthesis